jgi:pyruvate,water dikinase
VARSGAPAVVVRSSSTGEDGSASSMAGVFESVLDVRDEAGFRAAVDAVVVSGGAAQRAGLVDADMAVLVQPMLDAAWGGVLFGADPVSGRRDRFVVAAVQGGPAALVSGEASGWTAALDRRGRVVEVRSSADASTPAPPAPVLRALVRLGADVAATFGGPQDVEWAVDGAGTLRLLQARPITALAPRSGIVLGPGPVAETFPEPLARLEQDLWLDPLRDGLREALRLAGTSPAKALERSPLVVAIEGSAAVDLELLGVDRDAGGFLRKLDPRPPARRLRAAWRVGRLRAAFSDLAADVVRQVDADLAAVPALGGLGNHELLAVLRNGQRALRSLHGHEALAGVLVPDATAGGVTGASLALSAVAQARAEGVALCDLVERDPVVLALVPPRIGPEPLLDCLDGIDVAPHHADVEDPAPDPAAVAREALRLRVRWVQELTGRAAWELGRRLVDVGILPSHDAIRLLTIDELTAAVQRRAVPVDLADRAEPAGRALPTRFRLADDGTPVAVAAASRRRARAGRAGDGAVGASAGVATGPVHLGDDPPAGSVLVVRHLDPRLAPVIGRLAGLVAETGNPLSHLAILAREHGVPTVVGMAGATERFQHGDHVVVDGDNGSVTLADLERMEVPR